ncbi:MAG TPA: hypothetical protein P5092_20545, partial [Ruminococcus sp.]|nr:hypothetical protein [Ruminococcus sp.]
GKDHGMVGRWCSHIRNACPSDKYWYRMAYDRWRSILRKVFTQENRWTKLNCTIDEYVNGAWNGGLLRPEPTDK